MATKQELKQNFSTGQKPTGAHFAEMIEAFVTSVNNAKPDAAGNVLIDTSVKIDNDTLKFDGETLKVSDEYTEGVEQSIVNATNTLNEHVKKQASATESGHVKVDGKTIKTVDDVISVDGSIVNHVTDKTAHIDESERNSWNNKADKEYVEQKVADLVNTTSETLNTLNEVTAAIEEAESTLDGLFNVIGEKATTNDLNAHVSNKNNPHAVTKEQVGLSDVDNTSDLDKPISTAVQAALDTKVETTTLDVHIADRNVHLTQQERTMVIDSARFLDTRDDNFLPSYYRLKSTGVHKEFKSVGAIGLTLELAGGSYAAVETIVHYAHLSGGSLTQIAYCQSGLVFIRKSNNDDSGWFGWVRQINQNELNPYIARITALENTVADLTSRVEKLEGV